MAVLLQTIRKKITHSNLPKFLINKQIKKKYLRMWLNQWFKTVLRGTTALYLRMDRQARAKHSR